MIDHGVVELFTASLTHLMDARKTATGFQFNSLSPEGHRNIHVFIVRDEVVAKQITEYFATLSKDHGGRQEFKIFGIGDDDDPTQETPGNGN